MMYKTPVNRLSSTSVAFSSRRWIGSAVTASVIAQTKHGKCAQTLVTVLWAGSRGQHPLVQPQAVVAPLLFCIEHRPGQRTQPGFIVTAGGKNIAPTKLEALIKNHPLVGQACVIGDRRKYLSALVVLDGDMAPAWAERQGIAFSDMATFSALYRDGMPCR